MSDNSSGIQASPQVSAVNVPNALTVLRLILVPVLLWMLLQDSVAISGWAALAVFLFAAFTDALDGHIARSRNLITNFGRIADPIADKALTLGAFIIFSYLGQLPWYFTIAVAIRELGVTLLRAILLRRGVVVSANSGGKLKTALQMILITVLIIPWVTFMPDATLGFMGIGISILAGFTLGVTLWTGGVYLYEALRAGKTSGDSDAVAQTSASQDSVPAMPRRESVMPTVLPSSVDEGGAETGAHTATPEPVATFESRDEYQVETTPAAPPSGAPASTDVPAAVPTPMAPPQGIPASTDMPGPPQGKRAPIAAPPSGAPTSTQPPVAHGATGAPHEDTADGVITRAPVSDNAAPPSSNDQPAKPQGTTTRIPRLPSPEENPDEPYMVVIDPPLPPRH
ncbi:MAG: CDP-diacylglycerol--glycerol-3-phosphate 3-phosphatidyltransferase [Actinomycetaceae bacterium]|nr:CDP-diacylglycerol--glycerol-3-phosphate 3-phosphatidyltransferase [Actinomycetaceae bacterium]